VLLAALTDNAKGGPNDFSAADIAKIESPMIVMCAAAALIVVLTLWIGPISEGAGESAGWVGLILFGVLFVAVAAGLGESPDAPGIRYKVLWTVILMPLSTALFVALGLVVLSAVLLIIGCVVLAVANGLRKLGVGGPFPVFRAAFKEQLSTCRAESQTRMPWDRSR
jgi:hypothetical protein